MRLKAACGTKWEARRASLNSNTPLHGIKVAGTAKCSTGEGYAVEGQYAQECGWAASGGSRRGEFSGADRIRLRSRLPRRSSAELEQECQAQREQPSCVPKGAPEGFAELPTRKKDIGSERSM